MCISCVFLPLFEYKHTEKLMIIARLSSLQRTSTGEMFHLRPDKSPWQHSWTCAYASPDDADIYRRWKNSRAHQYWWFQTDNGRVSCLSHPMTDTDVPPPKKKKDVLLPSVGLKASFPLWDRKEGDRVFLDYRAAKVFWCSTCSCLIKLRLKVLCPLRRTAQNNPHFVTLWFMIVVLPWYPGALWCTKLVFFSPFSFPSVFGARRKNWYHEMYKGLLFLGWPGWAGPKSEWTFLPNARLCAWTSFNFISLISFVPLHLWHKIIPAKPTVVCKPVLLHYLNCL